MTDSYRNGFEFVAKVGNMGGTKYIHLCRRNGTVCYCPYTIDNYCSSICPHFVLENCSIVDKKCQLILTCGKYTARYLEIVE